MYKNAVQRRRWMWFAYGMLIFTFTWLRIVGLVQVRFMQVLSARNTATHCNTLQHTATHNATHCNTLQRIVGLVQVRGVHISSARHTATPCNTFKLSAWHTLQHTALCDTVLWVWCQCAWCIVQISSARHTVTHRSTLHSTATHGTALHHSTRHTVTHFGSQNGSCRSLLHGTLYQTASHCNALQHSAWHTATHWNVLRRIVGLVCYMYIHIHIVTSSYVQHNTQHHTATQHICMLYIYTHIHPMTSLYMTSHKNNYVCYTYSLLHLKFYLISSSNLNLLGLFLTERGKRDLQN